MAYNTAPGRAEYTATAGQTVFPFVFKIYVETDIKVYLTPVGQTPDDTVDLLTLGTDYTVAITGDAGGSITLLTGATLNDAVTLKRDLPVDRTTEYQTSGDLLATTLNADQDYQTYLTADQTVNSARHITLPDSIQGIDVVLPNPAPLKGFRWDAIGDKLENVTLDNGTFVNSFDSVSDRSELLLRTGKQDGEAVLQRDIGLLYAWTDTQKVDNNGTIINVGTGSWVAQYSGAVDVKWFNAKGDGVTDDSTAIQDALDSLDGVGGTVLLSTPIETKQYYIGATTLLVPSKVEFTSDSPTNVLTNNPHIRYIGTDAAIALKDSEADIPQRGTVITNIGVQLNTAGATGFRIWRVRDLTLRGCVVSMKADSQIGYHIKGERDGGVRLGVFDCLFERLISYSGSTHTLAEHYKLTGVLNDGQVNACLFNMCRGGGAGKFIEVGPSDGNTFISMEAEALTGDWIDFGDYAFNNKVFGGYGEAQAAWTGVYMRTTSLALRNEVIAGTLGINMSADDLSLTSGNVFKWAGNRTYVDSDTTTSDQVRVVGDANGRITTTPEGFNFGNGTDAEDSFIGRKTALHNLIEESTLDPAITPDTSNGNNIKIRFLAGASGTATINLATNLTEGEVGTFHIINNSGVVMTLSWNSNYIKNTEFPTSMLNGNRVTFQYLKEGTQIFMIGTKLQA